MSRFDTIYAIDPGPAESALVILGNPPDPQEHIPARFLPNDAMLEYLRRHTDGLGLLTVEWLECQGAVVGASTFYTAFWIGRFAEAWGGPYAMILRREVKLYLCGSTKAKDAHIREAVIARLGAPGTKKAQGPTYGWAGHCWQAGGVALTAAAGLWGTGGPTLRVASTE